MVRQSVDNYATAGIALIWVNKDKETFVRVKDVVPSHNKTIQYLKIYRQMDKETDGQKIEHSDTYKNIKAYRQTDR